MAEATLLLVDDSATNRRVFARMVKHQMADCTLHTATNAGEGLAMAPRVAPDCAIIDVDMPGMDGIELCRRLKADDATAHFPILLITALDADSRLRVSGLEAGADDFMQRSAETVDLIAKIRVLLRIKRAEDELRAVNKRLAGLAGERSEEMHEYEERYQMLFNACSDGVIVFDIFDERGGGRFIEVNDNACTMTGYSHEEFLQLPLPDLFSPDLQGGVQGRIESILKHKQVFFETQLLGRNGQGFPVAIHARSFLLRHSKLLISVVKDMRGVTAHPESEGDSDRRYRTLAAQTGQMIYDFNVRSGKVKWGGAFTQVTGWTSEEIASFSWEELTRAIHPEDYPGVLTELNNAMEAVGTFQIVYRIRHRSGENRHVDNLGVVLPGEDGKACRILGTIKDVTARVRAEEERRRIEQEMQHSQKLESLGVLAGGIAHDFNNILAAIIGLTDIAIEDLPDGSDTQRDLKEALQAAHRAKDLVKQILTFSRQSGQERAPLFLHVIARETLKLLRASIPATIEIIDSVDVHSGAVLANATQMHQVVMNYCTNAAQAMPEQHGRLEVRVVDTDVDERLAATHSRLRPGPYVKLSVSDTGYGMEDRVLNRIFDPFYTTKGPGEGTGMGLAVVHGIVMAHGGAIAVESRPDKGATFHTYLPRVAAGDAPAERKVETMPRGHERVIFVDDEEGVIRFGESMLPRLGYAVTFCSSAHEALEAFNKAPEAYDLVITDQIMPRMTGETMAAQIHARRADLPIILFTGFSENFDLDRLRDVGIVEIVMKPVIAMDLAKRMRRVLDGEESQ